MRIAAAPEKGKANGALVSYLAGVLDLSRAAVAVVAGHASRDKVIEIVGLSPSEIESRLTRARERRA